MNDLEIPPTALEIVDALKQATGISNVTFAGDTFIIDFSLKEMGKVKGLVQNGGGFHLSYSEFNALPICFNVRVGAATHQYYTVNKQLHRVGGRPSYIAFDPSNNNRVIRRWNWNGIAHRDRGPAKEMISKFEISDTGIKDHAKQSWDHMNLEWYREGVKARYPSPSKATIKEGWKIVNTETGALNSPESDIPAWSADRVEIVWDSPVHDEELRDMFMPQRVEILNMVEFYDQGRLVSRDCDAAHFTWYRRGDTLGPDGIMEFSEITRKMITDFGLWDEPFYKDEGHEFVLLTEFDRVGTDE